MVLHFFAAALVFGIAQAPSAASAEAVQVAFVRDGVFVSPTDEAWSAIPETTQTLQQQMIMPPVGGGAVAEVAVRAVHDGEEVAIRLEWADTTADRGVGVDTFRDAAAIGFPVGRPETPPSPFMGDEEHPVVIWQWAADFDADAEGKGRFGERYPHSEGVWIYPQDMTVRRKVRAWRGARPVIEYVAKGFGTLTPRMGTTVEGTGVHADGRWSVVLRRALTTANPEDAEFVPGEKTPLILAVWDGSQGEINGRKSVTFAWIPALFEGIEPTTTTKVEAGLSGGK